MDKPLYPEYLNEGSIDAGTQGPVRFLQQILCSLGVKTEDDRDIIIDGVYGEGTASAVRMLQNDTLEVDPDGNFGPATREALYRVTSIDVNAIPAIGDCTVSVKMPDIEDLQRY